MPKSLVFVTGNANKLREVRAILASGGVPLQLESRALDLPEIQGSTQEVALEKVKEAARIINGPVIIEDTALCFRAMSDLPGPYIKWFLQKLGHDGLNKMLFGFSDHRAYALCTFAYSAGPGAEPLLFEGRTEGKIVPPRGPTDFGWTAIFEPEEGDGKTYAELKAEDKNKISHRYRALEKLRKYLDEHPPSSRGDWRDRETAQSRT